MLEKESVTGLILKSGPIGEYDKRVVILTRERGKISAFAKGARKPANKLSGRTDPFFFGSFKIYEGRNSYTISDAEISEYFTPFRSDYEASVYGTYFLEIADYFTRENNDEERILTLLFLSLKALFVGSIKRDLTRYIFEIRALVENGEFPGVPSGVVLSSSAQYTLDHIVNSPLDKLYTFKVSDKVLDELSKCCANYRRYSYDKTFKSLELFKSLPPK